MVEPEQGGKSVDVDKILEQIMNQIYSRENSVVTERTYSDQPIIRKGGDYAKDWEERRRQREAARQERAEQRSQLRQQRQAASREQGVPQRPDGSSKPHNVHLREASAASYSLFDTASFDDGWPDSRFPRESFNARPRSYQVELPPLLKELRAMQPSERVTTQEAGKVFAKQARLAESYTDSYKPGRSPLYYLPTYAKLTDAELRQYFGWRTAWREGRKVDMPSAFVSLLAFELINGVGCTPGNDGLEKLKALRDAYEQGGYALYWSSDQIDFKRWIRDYAVVHGLDPKGAFSEQDLAFDGAVATLRAAERAKLGELMAQPVRRTNKDKLPPPPPPGSPDDEKVFAALGQISSSDVSRSPFFRQNEEAAAHVCAGVFRRQVEHCEKRRKVGFLDGIFGPPTSVEYRPLWGVPLGEKPDLGTPRLIRVTPAASVSWVSGRWLYRVQWSYRPEARARRDVSKLLRAIDCRMRQLWGFKHLLKEQPVPKYLSRMIEEECQAELAREKASERIAFTVDLSKLGGIRAAAATTREALLVDDEREDAPGQRMDAESLAAPAPAATESLAAPASAATAPLSAPSQAAATPPPASPSTAAAPAGLTSDELSLLRALLGGEAPAPRAPGSPSLDMLVDSINEKLFDLVGDTVIEFDDEDPCLVEDYLDDLRGFLGQ